MSLISFAAFSMQNWPKCALQNLTQIGHVNKPAQNVHCKNLTQIGHVNKPAQNVHCKI